MVFAPRLAASEHATMLSWSWAVIAMKKSHDSTPAFERHRADAPLPRTTRTSRRSSTSSAVESSDSISVTACPSSLKTWHR